jgi:hypothetical protein
MAGVAQPDQVSLETPPSSLPTEQDRGWGLDNPLKKAEEAPPVLKLI